MQVGTRGSNLAMVQTKNIINALSEKTDEEIAAEQDDKASILGKLTLEEWAFILQYRGYQTDLRASLLTHAEYGGWEAVQAYLQSIQSCS